MKKKKKKKKKKSYKNTILNLTLPVLLRTSSVKNDKVKKDKPAS